MNTGNFFGRRKGRPLRAHQQSLLDGLLSRLSLDLASLPPDEVKSLFDTDVQEVHLEIGFGGGERLIEAATRCPQIGFIGIEPFINGMAKLLSHIDAHPELAHNIRLYAQDATLVLDWLPPNCLDQIDLFYPDPWHKKKHWKRRFVNQANLDRFARILKPGGHFRFASDIHSYIEWTREHCAAHHAFTLKPSDDDWREPYPHWHSTRYETKALKEGRSPRYLTFSRL